MALRTILLQHDETLKKKSRPVESFDARLHQLLDDMTETMKEANGLGLAAPQVGVLRRAAVIATPDGAIIELVNPTVVSSAGKNEGAEGCLSVPGVFGIVIRPQTIVARAQDRHGAWFELSVDGLPARAVCHEVEHLEGELFLDKVIRFIDRDEMEHV